MIDLGILKTRRDDIRSCFEVTFPKKRKLFRRGQEGTVNLVGSIKKLSEYAISNNMDVVSANEVKLSDRMIYVKKGTFGNVEDLVLINPRVVESYGKVQTVEGGQFSYDLPTQTSDVSYSETRTFVRSIFRPYRIVVSYRTENGKEEKIDLEGRAAVIFLQRYHLLDGITPVDIDNHSGEIKGDDYVIESKDTQNAVSAVFSIKDMGKGCCSHKLEPIIENIPGVISCRVSPNFKTVTVRFSNPIVYSSELDDVIKRQAIYQEIISGIETFKDEGVFYEITEVKFKDKDRVGAVFSRTGILPKNPNVESTGRERGSGRPAHRRRIFDTGK